MWQVVPNETCIGDRYVVEELIASGGFGAVYKVHDQRLHGQIRALKIAFASKDNEPLRREVELLTLLDHPGLPRIHDAFSESVGQCLVMDYIAGEDLGTRCHRQACSIAQARTWLVALGDTLTYLHTHQPPIIHRDIKPQNLKINHQGQIILLDFGLAKGAPDGMTVPLKTQLGYTAHYASLEQIRNSTTDARSDVYALAATFYTLLTGQVPPDALERVAAKISENTDPLCSPQIFRSSIPKPLADAITKAMALDTRHRYSSVAAFVAAALQAETNLVESHYSTGLDTATYDADDTCSLLPILSKSVIRSALMNIGAVGITPQVCLTVFQGLGVTASESISGPSSLPAVIESMTAMLQVMAPFTTPVAILCLALWFVSIFLGPMLPACD